MSLEVELDCSCGHRVDIKHTTEPIFNCPEREDNEQWHVLQANLGFDTACRQLPQRCADESPYETFADFLAVSRIARVLDPQHGADIYQSAVRRLDGNLWHNIGKGFRETPVLRDDALRERLGFFSTGGIFLKVDAGNVTGSHKGRHAAGTALYLETLREIEHEQEPRKNLVIYSCGNAALGAAAIARAAEYPLDVFVPENVDPTVLRELIQYRARVNICVSPEFYGVDRASYESVAAGTGMDYTEEQRRLMREIANLRQRFGDAASLVLHKNPRERRGDPTYLRFRAALAQGALPISCSGPDNWSNIDGGKTIALEFASQLERDYRVQLDTLVIQVGGGALASSVIQAYEEMTRAALSPEKMPKIYAVQTMGGFPLVRAYYLLLKAIASRNGLPWNMPDENDERGFVEAMCVSQYSREFQTNIDAIISFAASSFRNDEVQSVLREAVEHPARFMQPWHEEPKSVAHGILDDVTYDWLAIIKAILKTGGRALFVTEEQLEQANGLVNETTAIGADHTGTAGVAGVMALLGLDIIHPYEKVGVFITGKKRDAV